MRVRRDFSLPTLLDRSVRQCRGRKRGVRWLVCAVTCAFLCSIVTALPVFADGVELDQKDQKRSMSSKSGAATSGVPGSSPTGESQEGKSATAQSAADNGGAVEETGADEKKGPKLSDFDLARYQYCGEDSDCVVELNGCCQCETGAQEVAVNKNRVEAFRSQFVGCAEVSCGPITASEHCGGGVVSCIEHRCRFFPADEEI